jgi:diguanylate cyclase (GGDEF)-like protein
MTTDRLRWTHWRLGTRIVALSLLVLLLVQAAGFAVIHWSVERNARQTLSKELAVGERIFTRLLDQRSQKLTQGAAVLATDYGFREAVTSGDVETIQSALHNHGARIGAQLVALLDTDLRLRAMDEDDVAAAAMLNQLPGTVKADRQPGPWMALVEGRPYQLVIVPMRAPLVVGWVVMGFPLDEAVAEDMRLISGLHLAVLSAPPTAPMKLAVTTLNAGVVPEFERSLRQAGSSDEIVVAGEPVLIHRMSLPVRGGEAQAVLMRPVVDAVAPYRPLQMVLAMITVGGLVLFGLGSAATARQVTTPLRALVEASERLGRGDYHEPLADTERHDEIGDLAQAFDRMRVNIATHQQEVHQLAYWDRLTGLPNRTQFRDQVQSAIERSEPEGDGLAVLMLDLDRFKHVNDVLGYAFGDRLLAAVAERLRGQMLRREDLIARLGGDEFAVLLPHGGLAQGQAFAERVAAAFATPLHLDDHLIDLSAGVGIACWPIHATDAETLLSRAEIAMYSAKRRTAGAQIYDPTIDSTSAQTLSLLTELRRAVDQDELRLYLQPKIALASGRVGGAEALIRWQHPTRGLVPPMAFIPFAEQTGFIRNLTLWMFEEGARQWATLASLGLTRMSINLSTRDLLDQDLPDKLDTLLARHRVPARAFCLEITESAIMDDPDRAEATLARLHQRGFELSIDDFGTGYSSLAYLKRLPVSELKIDKSFVMAMERDEGDAKIVRSTIDLAHNLGLKVVAEGVENQAVYDALRTLTCDEAQGFFMSKPLPVNEFVAWTARWQTVKTPAGAQTPLTSQR